MVSIGQVGTVQDAGKQDEWDRVWKDHDRRRPAVALPHPEPLQPVADSRPATRTGTFLRKRHNRGHAAMLALAACLTLAPLPGLPKASRYPGAAEALSSLFSLAPEEAEMPPLTAAVSRLAAESSAAACWVMRLAPRMPPHATPWSQPCIEP